VYGTQWKIWHKLKKSDVENYVIVFNW
jgi:hypothetical protein